MLNVRSGSRKLKRQNDSNIITAINRKNDLRIFILNSTPGFQFSLIVLFAIARKYYHDRIRKDGNNNQRTNNNFVFAFSSREFRDTYSKIACDLGLSRHLVREIAFPEYTFTLLYLGFIREKEDTGEYEFSLSLDESKWLASVALNIIETGIRSPMEHDTGIFSRNLRSNQEIEDLINEIVLTKPSSNQRRDKQEEEEDQSEKLVTPRSRDYGKGRPSYIPNKQPPTTYSLRKKLTPDEIKRLQKEFMEETCEDCGRKILLDDFDIWIGEPMRRTPSNVQDQRMNDILANSTTMTKEYADNNITISLDSKIHSTEREILELGYGILPMDGRNGFIAFAKPIRNCPICGYNTWNSMSVSPNF